MNFLVHQIDYDKFRNREKINDDTNIILREGLSVSFEELQEKYHMLKRDRYIIDKNIDLNACMIVIKKNCIVLQIDVVRCIITTDHVLIFSDKSRSCAYKIIDLIKKSLIEKHTGTRSGVLNDSDVFDEFTVLEEIFIFISTMYEDRTDQLITDVSDINRRFNNNELDKSVKNVIPLTDSRVIDLKYKACDIKDKFLEILSWDDEDMGEFCLERNTNTGNNTDNTDNNANNKDVIIEQVETLFENYKEHFEDYDNKLGTMEKQLNLFMKKLNLLYLDKRNQIAIFDTYISIITLAVTIASVISSIYGMNLTNHLEDNSIAFFVTVGFIIVIVVVSCTLLAIKFKLIYEK